VIDFGFSAEFCPENPFMQTICGTPAYRAPELVCRDEYTPSCDIWSAGVLLYLMTVGDLPFTGETPGQLFQDIIERKPKIPATLSPQLAALIEGLLNKDPRARFEFRDILTHPWLAEYYQGHADTVEYFRRLRIHSVSDLDEAVITQLRLIGYNSTNMLFELRLGRNGANVSGYRMLRRKRINEVMNFGKLGRDVSVRTGRIKPAQSWGVRKSLLLEIPARRTLEAQKELKGVRLQGSHVRLPDWSRVVELTRRRPSVVVPPCARP
jgi:serine/threonine protein kinase